MTSLHWCHTSCGPVFERRFESSFCMYLLWIFFHQLQDIYILCHLSMFRISIISFLMLHFLPLFAKFHWSLVGFELTYAFTVYWHLLNIIPLSHRSLRTFIAIRILIFDFFNNTCLTRVQPHIDIFIVWIINIINFVYIILIR